MVLGLDLFISLFNNLAIFIALLALYRAFSKMEIKGHWIRRQVVLGFTFGAFAVLCMNAKIPVSQGVIVDQRNAIVALGGAFGGPLAAVVGAIFAGSYRLYLGGEGALAGVIGVFLAATAGTVLHVRGNCFSTLPRAASCSFFATLVILPGFLFYKDLATGLALLGAMALPYGLAIFIGIFLVGTLLWREQERQAMENAYSKTEQMYRDLIENTEDLVTHVDAQGKYIYANHMSEPILGLAPEECVGLSAFEHLHPDDRERSVQWFNASVEAGALQGKIENRLVNVRTGQVTDIMWSVSFHYGEDGALIGVGGIARDMTKYKQAEEAMQSEILRRKALMDIASDGIAIFNQEHQVVDANQSFAENLGYTMEELLTLHSWDWDVNYSEDDIRKNFSDLTVVRNTIETLHRRKDGTVYDAEVSASGVVIGDEAFAVTITRDITDRKRTQEYLLQSEKMMSIGGVAAGIAHEINNPLASISGGAQNLKRRLLDELEANTRAAQECGVPFEAVQEYARLRKLPGILQGIIDSANRASGIVRNLLDFSRKSDNVLTANDLGVLLDETVELVSSDYDLRKHCDFRSIEIRRDYEPGVLCECEAGQIRQVFLNLMKNAAHAMAEKRYDGEKPRLLFTIRRRDGMAVVEIEDNGPGLDEAQCKRIFEPFFTTKPPGMGTGLGLSISYFIVASQHKGRMEAVSSPGEWTRFVIELPLTRGA